MEKKRVAILISGRGSNMGALIAAAQSPDYPVEIACVISDRPEAAGLESAQKAGIPTRVIVRREGEPRAAQEARIDADLLSRRVDFVCLAGYMRVLSATFVDRWRDRVINIHPSLLPAYRGLHTHERAIADGARVHGCTVHIVSPDLDAGPIIGQSAIAVAPDDDADSLAAKVLREEHRLYPLCLAMMAIGAARVEGDRVVLRAAAQPSGGPIRNPA